MTPRYIDTHCHIQLEQYAEDRDEIIRKMHEERIVGVVVGDDYGSSVQAVELAEKYEHLYAAVGMHPDQINKEDSI
jgi:TatD DNase family protein